MNSNTFHDFENIKPQFVIMPNSYSFWVHISDSFRGGDPKSCICIKIGMYTLYLSIGLPLNITL